MSRAIQIEGLTKDYGAGRGLFDLNLDVEVGEVFGYLGPNGSGKSTTIRLLMDLVHPTSGSAAIFGLNCRRQSVDIKRLVGYVAGEVPEFGGLRGREIVAYLGSMAGRVDAARTREISERLGLDLSRRYREYSTGNKKKLALALAFMHEPRLLILDEPTSGLDPLNQRVFYELVGEAKQAGATVFLSSHVLSEVEHVCDRVGIIRAGRLVKVASLQDLHELRVHRVEIEFAGAPPIARLAAIEGIADLSATEHRVSCVVRGGFQPLLQALTGSQVVSLTSREPSLEETFLEYYGSSPEANAKSLIE